MNTRAEHHFFTASGIWYLITAFWGFAPSFYLSKYFDNPEPLPIHLIIHGVVFTIWTILYAVQVFLIRYKNVRLHQTLGIFGLCILILMIPTGIFPSIYKVYAGTTTLDSAGHNVFRLSSAYFLFALAFLYRRKLFLHKRLMLGGMVMIIGAAIFRISFDLNLQDSQLFNKGLQVFPAIMLFTFDLVWHKKAVLIDLVSVVLVIGIYFFGDWFWLSKHGEALMDILISIFVIPFL